MTNYDLLVVLAIVASVHITGLVVLGIMLRGVAAMVAESQRLTRAVGALVIQEEEKTRSLFSRG